MPPNRPSTAETSAAGDCQGDAMAPAQMPAVQTTSFSQYKVVTPGDTPAPLKAAPPSKAPKKKGLMDRPLRGRQALQFLQSEHVKETDKAYKDIEKIDPGFYRLKALGESSTTDEGEEMWPSSWITSKGTFQGWVTANLIKWLTELPEDLVKKAEEAKKADRRAKATADSKSVRQNMTDHVEGQESCVAKDRAAPGGQSPAIGDKDIGSMEIAEKHTDTGPAEVGAPVEQSPKAATATSTISKGAIPTAGDLSGGNIASSVKSASVHSKVTTESASEKAMDQSTPVESQDATAPRHPLNGAPEPAGMNSTVAKPTPERGTNIGGLSNNRWASEAPATSTQPDKRSMAWTWGTTPLSNMTAFEPVIMPQISSRDKPGTSGLFAGGPINFAASPAPQHQPSSSVNTMPLLSLTGLSSGISQLLQETSSNLANTSTTPEVPSASSNAPASMSQTIPTRQHPESSTRVLTEANLRKHEATSPPAPRGGIRGRTVNQDEDPPREWYEWYRVYQASQREARRNGGVREE